MAAREPHARRSIAGLQEQTPKGRPQALFSSSGCGRGLEAEFMIPLQEGWLSTRARFKPPLQPRKMALRLLLEPTKVGFALLQQRLPVAGDLSLSIPIIARQQS